jgi:hypothetical protein
MGRIECFEWGDSPDSVDSYSGSCQVSCFGCAVACCCVLLRALCGSSGAVK